MTAVSDKLEITEDLESSETLRVAVPLLPGQSRLFEHLGPNNRPCIPHMAEEPGEY